MPQTGTESIITTAGFSERFHILDWKKIVYGLKVLKDFEEHFTLNH